MSFKKTFLKNLFILGSYNLSTQLSSFLLSVIASRLISPESFGLVGLITVFTGFIATFSDNGISQVVIRSPYGSIYHKGLFALAVITGFLSCILTLFLVYPVSFFYSNPEIIYPGIAIAFLFVVRSLYIVPLGLLQKKLAFSYIGKINLFAGIINIVAVVLLALLGLQYWALILPQFLVAFYLFAAFNHRIRLVPSRRWAVVKKTFQITRKIIGSMLGFNIVNYWSRNLDNLLAGKLYGPFALGIYSRGYSMLNFSLVAISGLFSSVLYPSLVKLKTESGNVQAEYYFILKIISIINIPAAFILLIFPETISLLLWGKNWIGVSYLLPYFGLLMLTQTLLSTAGNILLLEHKERNMMVGGWISSAFMMGGIVLGSLFSIVKIAAFYSLFYILLVLPFNMVYLYYKTLGHSISLMLKFWMPKILVSLLMWMAIYYSNDYVLYGGLAIWLLMILSDAQKEIRKVYTLLRLNKSNMYNRQQ